MIIGLIILGALAACIGVVVAMTWAVVKEVHEDKGFQRW